MQFWINYKRKYKWKVRKEMLIIDENSVYEIDEECLKKRKVAPECNVIEKVKEYQKKEAEQKKKGKK